MEGFELELAPRERMGSSASRQYRKEGLIPTVVYSHGQKGMNALVSSREFVRLARLSRTSQIFSFKSSESTLNGVSAFVRSIQRDHLTGDVVHVDFQSFREDEEISVEVGLKFVGEAKGVKLDGGILTMAMHAVTVRCLPKSLPQEIQVDVSDLSIGHSLHLRDLKLPEGVKVEGEPGETVAAVVSIHVVVEEPTAAAAAVEGAAPAEGAAAAPGAESAKAGAPEKKEGEKSSN